MYVRMNECVCMCECMCMYECLCMYVCVSVCMYVCMCVCMHVCMYVLVNECVFYYYNRQISRKHQIRIDIPWLDPNKTLCEQDVTEDDELLLMYRFHYNMELDR